MTNTENIEIHFLKDQIKDFQKIPICSNNPIEIFDSFPFKFHESKARDLLNYGWAKSSGVYILFSSTRVLYIGKAASNNMAPELWSKFGSKKTPYNPVWVHVPHEISEILNKGEFYILLIKTEKAMASLLEVFLQTAYHYKFKHHKSEDLIFPICNRRIG